MCPEEKINFFSSVFVDRNPAVVSLHRGFKPREFFETTEYLWCRGVVVSGQWSVVSGQWSVASGQWSVVSGQWPVASGQWPAGWRRPTPNS